MNTLFDDLPESKSPRLLWMEKHGVKTGNIDGKEWFAWTPKQLEKAKDEWLSQNLEESEFPTRPCKPDNDFDVDSWYEIAVWFDFGSGDTEDAAVTDWARENGVRLWNEEP